VKSGKKSNSFDIDMIFKEAENLKALNHPNIIKILNCYALSDMRVVIVM
jgi:serine/threonine protein kinase